MLKIRRKKKVFTPTGTSDLLIESIISNEALYGKVLDLGAGTGYVGLKLSKSSESNFELYASDLTNTSKQLIKLNAKLNKIKIIAKSGNLFAPWKGNRFDFIVNDVSGISEQIANISNWFKGISCKSGKDGTNLTIKVINQAKNYLNSKGVLYFPTLSLSKEKKILEAAKKKFKTVKKIAEKEWVLPKEMNSHQNLLEKMKKKGYIKYKKKFGLIIWTTKIYKAF